MRPSFLFAKRCLPRLWVLAAVWVAECCFAFPTALAQTQALEADIKAAIISNMLLFVEWPTSTTAPSDQIVVCYQDVSPVSAALVKLDGKSIKNKTLRVVPFSSESAGKCHAVYISPGNAGNFSKLTAGLGTLPVFVAGDSPDYLQHGIMLNLDVVSGHVVFDIDLNTAQRTGLQISSKALRLARHVLE